MADLAGPILDKLGASLWSAACGADWARMSGGLSLAAVHPAGTRLLVAVVVLFGFAGLLPRPAPRPLAVSVLSALVVIWDFGATLIWGSPASSKVRLGFALTGAGGSALLACALVGILAAGGAVRSFAVGRDRAGQALSLTFAVSFIFWSAAVRYSPLIAVISALAGGAALWWASREPPDAQPASPSPGLRHAAASVLRVGAGIVLPPACGALYYASLRWGPKTWADPACGATLIVPAFVAAIAIPALAVGLTTRASGRRTEAALAGAVLAALLTAAICVVVFIIWFGQNHCGE